LKLDQHRGDSALCNPIVLREGERVRLVFNPAVVDNDRNPQACIDGEFIYQRKAASGRWINNRTASLSTLREGEGFKLAIHAQELMTLLESLVPLYRLHRAHGVPKGSKRFVEVDPHVAKFLSQGGEDLGALLQSSAEGDSTVLLRLVKWLSTG
jgi:hypothetical protein